MEQSTTRPWFWIWAAAMVAIPDDGVHGGADFVAHAGKEIALGGVGLLCARQRVLERLPGLHLVGAIRQGHDVPDGARVSFTGYR